MPPSMPTGRYGIADARGGFSVLNSANVRSSAQLSAKNRRRRLSAALPLSREWGMGMSQSEVEHWQWKATRARDAAAKMLGETAKSIMLDIADYYEQPPAKPGDQNARFG